MRRSPIEVGMLMLIGYGLALLLLLRGHAFGLVELGFYGVAFEPAVGLGTLLALFVATLPALHVCPARLRTGALLGHALLFLALAFGPATAAAQVAAATLGFAVCRGCRRFTAKAALLSAILLLPAAGRWIGAAPVSVFGFAFAMLTGFKVFLFAFETHARRPEWRELPRYLVYLFLAPNALVPPYHVVVPSYGAFWRSDRPAARADVALRGLGLLGLALLDAGLLFAVAANHEALLSAAGGHSLVALHLRFLELYLGVAVAAHALVGMTNGLGFGIAPAMRMPYLSRSFLEFLSRFVPYFKEWVATLFYYPFVLRFRKRLPPRALQLLGVVNALVIGNTAAHVLRYAFSLDDPAHRARLAEVVLENALFALVIAVYFALLRPWEAWRDRTLTGPLRPLAAAVGLVERAVTVTLFAWLFFFSFGGR